jgi:hypothetical protein
MRLKNYNDFTSQSKNTNEGNSSNYMAKYSLSEFRNMISDSILEKDEFIKEEKINRIHASYELEMLYESKSHWEKTPGSIYHVDFDSHILLVKNSEGFIIEKKTFEMSNNGELENSEILEDWGWRDLVPDFIEKRIDKVSEGGKKVLEWVKKAKAAIKEFVHHNHKAISIILSILTAVFGIAGIVAPGLSVLGGICMMLNGTLHISHGWGEFKKGKEVLGQVSLKESGKALTSGIINGLPGLLSGSLMMFIGLNDVWHGSTTAMTPAGAAAAVHSEATKKGAMAAVEKTVTGIGATIEHTVEAGIVWFTEHVVPNTMKFAGDTLLPEAAKGLAAGALGIGSIYLHVALKKMIGLIYQTILESIDGVVSALNGLLKIPGKISDSISKFSESAKGFVGKLVSKGLNKLVKPITDCISGFVEKYISPILNSVKGFISGQQMAVKILQEMEKSKPETKQKIENTQIQVIPKSEEKMFPNTEPVKISDEDKNQIEEIAEEGEEKNGGGEQKEQPSKEVNKEEQPSKEKESVVESKIYKYLIKEFNKFNY